jgi:hypothetical protein
LSDIQLWDKSTIESALLEDPETLVTTLNKNPALLEYVFSDADIQRKYVKLTPNVENKLKEYSESSGLPEGLLIGAGIALLLYLVFKKK